LEILPPNIQKAADGDAISLQQSYLPPNIQKAADGDAISLQQSYGGARDEITHSYISISTAPPSKAWAPNYRGHARQRPPKPFSLAASAYSSDTCFRTDNQRS